MFLFEALGQGDSECRLSIMDPSDEYEASSVCSDSQSALDSTDDFGPDFSESFSADAVALLSADTASSEGSQEVHEMLQDVYDLILERGVTPEMVPGSNTLLLWFAVPEPVKNVLNCPLELGFFVKFGCPGPSGVWPTPKVSLAPDAGGAGERSLVARCARSFSGYPPVEDQTSLRYVKPLLMAIRNDMEVVCLRERPQEALNRVWERLSFLSENYAGVFEMRQDMEKVAMVEEILADALASVKPTKNIVRIVVEVVAHNIKCIGERCYLCGVRHGQPLETQVPLPCCNDLCRCGGSPAGLGPAATIGIWPRFREVLRTWHRIDPRFRCPEPGNRKKIHRSTKLLVDGNEHIFQLTIKLYCITAPHRGGSSARFVAVQTHEQILWIMKGLPIRSIIVWRRVESRQLRCRCFLLKNQNPASATEHQWYCQNASGNQWASENGFQFIVVVEFLMAKTLQCTKSVCSVPHRLWQAINRPVENIVRCTFSS